MNQEIKLSLRKITKILDYFYIPFVIVTIFSPLSSFLNSSMLWFMIVMVVSLVMLILNLIDIPRRPRVPVSFFAYYGSIFVFMAGSYLTMFGFFNPNVVFITFFILFTYGIIFLVVPFKNKNPEIVGK